MSSTLLANAPDHEDSDPELDSIFSMLLEAHHILDAILRVCEGFGGKNLMAWDLSGDQEHKPEMGTTCESLLQCECKLEDNARNLDILEAQYLSAVEEIDRLLDDIKSTFESILGEAEMYLEH